MPGWLSGLRLLHCVVTISTFQVKSISCNFAGAQNNEGVIHSTLSQQPGQETSTFQEHPRPLALHHSGSRKLLRKRRFGLEVQWITLLITGHNILGSIPGCFAFQTFLTTPVRQD